MELLLILIKLKNCFYIVHVRLICVIKFYLLTYSLKVDFEIVGVTGIVIKQINEKQKQNGSRTYSVYAGGLLSVAE